MRLPARPTPTKPSSIHDHVDGSGPTAPEGGKHRASASIFRSSNPRPSAAPRANRGAPHVHEARSLQLLHKSLATIDDMRVVALWTRLRPGIGARGELRGKVRRSAGWSAGATHDSQRARRNMRTAIVFVAMLLALPVRADSPDISARRLLSNWKSQDPMMSGVAEVIAAAFSGGLSWRGSLAGKEIYCPPPGLKGHQIMISFEEFLNDNPDMADKPYGDAMASTLSRAFPCQAR